MEMFYENDTLFVDLSGNVDIASVKNKIFNVASTYKISNIVLSVSEVFNYKRSVFTELKNDYSRVYGGNIVIKR
jgi:uncharacterized protein YxjI